MQLVPNRNKKTIFLSVTGFLGLTLSITTPALSLLEAYHSALNKDSLMQISQAEYRSDEQLLPKAKSALLPQVNIAASASTANIYKNDSINSRSHGYQVTASQPLFNSSAVHSVSAARYLKQGANFKLEQDRQDLILRTVKAYFDVIRTYHQLDLIKVEKGVLNKEITAANLSFKHGVSSINQIYDLKAHEDLLFSQELLVRQDLGTKLEELQAIIGFIPKEFKLTSERVAVWRPTLSSFNEYLSQAEKNNLMLSRARNMSLAVLKQLKATRSNSYPVIYVQESYNYASSKPDAFSQYPRHSLETTVAVNWPVIQGGLNLAQYRSAKAEYEKSMAQVHQLYNSVKINLYSSYANLRTMQAKLAADRSSILSAAKALKANKIGLEVGERSILDVIRSQSNWYSSKRVYLDDQYQYLLSYLILKSCLGQLKEGDIKAIDELLGPSAIITA